MQSTSVGTFENSVKALCTAQFYPKQGAARSTESLLLRTIMDENPELSKKFTQQSGVAHIHYIQYPREIIAATAETTPERKLSLNLTKSQV